MSSRPAEALWLDASNHVLSRGQFLLVFLRRTGLGRTSEEALLARAQSPETTAALRTTMAEFQALQVKQRPTFLIENSIGDRVVFSGIARAEPLAAAIDALLADEAASASWEAHFGPPPKE